MQSNLTQEQKDAWIEALRSGRYKQGLGQLRTLDDEFCCLGVYGDIAGFPWEPSARATEYTLLCPTMSSSIRLPSEVMPAHIAYRLTAMNDGGASFPEIAGRIEKNVEVVG